MAQQSNRLCPKCNTPLAPSQRFCSNCGSIVEPSAYQPTELTPNSAGSVPEMGTYLETPPPPPPVGSYSQSSMPPQANYQPPQMGYQPPPSYATPPKDSSKKVLGQIGCGMLAIIVLAVALCGGIGFFVYHSISSSVSKVSQTTYTASNTGNSTSNVTPTLAPATTSPVNATIKYADVDIIIVDVKQAGGFSDDTSSPSGSVIVRIDLNESNKTAHASNFLYGDVMRLILSDGTSVIPSNAQYSISPDAAVTRTNWIDFPVTSTVDVTKLTLQWGKATDAQIAVPLTNNPDVTKYQPKTITPGTSTMYAGTKWTLVSATAQLSGDNEQAPKGQMFVILTVKIDNNSAQSFSASPDYLRLQTGDTKTVPESNSIPTSFDAGQTNQTGNALFLVPQGSTSFTFLLLANASTGATQQSSIAFQIQ
jgi:hypothetical protein